MLFTDPTFLFVFLPVLLALYALPWPRYRNWLLLVASVVFYASAGGAFTWFLLASVGLNYAAPLWIDRLRGTPSARLVLGATVVLNLLLLATFKYAGFVTTNLNALLEAASLTTLPMPAIVLPVGISFFTFHAISYVVDVYRLEVPPQRSPVQASVFLLFFPQLIAGPIIRYRNVAADLAVRSVTTADFAYGVRRFVIGLGKKVLLANILAAPVDRIFSMPAAELTAAHAWLAVGCYTLQIYFDFSGYSDMAIGLARMFGFRFPENFNYPYVARSIQEFWRRWHISLSSWFRDYVYVPLGGNRATARRVYMNLATVFLLCGLWHGANWTFVVWGAYHGLFLVLERRGLAAGVAACPTAIRHLYAITVVMAGWVFFRADSLGAALGMLRAMAGASPGAPTTFGVAWYLTPELVAALAAAIVGSGPIWQVLAARMATPTGEGTLTIEAIPSALVSIALTTVFFVSIMLIAARTYMPFIYARF